MERFLVHIGQDSDLKLSQVERIVIDMEHIYPTSRDIAETIKDAMRAGGVSQGELAIRTGMSKNTLNRRLNGAEPKYGELAEIAQALGRPISSLIAETEVRVAARSRELTSV